MIEASLIGLRAIQYAAAAVLLGAPAFLLYSAAALGGSRLAWPRPALRRAAAVLLPATLAALVLQTAIMAGSLAEAVRPATLAFMVQGTALGLGYAVRAGLAIVALALALLVRPGRGLWLALLGPGLLIAASFAWTGHGAATEGAWRWPHVIADVVHAVAALVWLGALFAFVVLASRRAPGERTALAAALTGFAGVGTAAVAALAASGLVNAWALVGPDGWRGLLSTPWGLFLAAKLVAFAGMLALAAHHRFRAAPALAAAGGEDAVRLSRLRRTLLLELVLGVVVLGLVAVMGLLPPPGAL